MLAPQEGFPMKETIGFIGLGRMGTPMARNLLRAGYAVRVYNRTPEKAQALAAEGAQVVQRPADVADPGSVVVTMVTDDEALERVTLGEDGFAETLGPGGVHLSMSTVSLDIARRLAAHHRERGGFYAAATVFGRPESAATQKLWINLAGPAAARERVRPLLQALGQTISEFGDDPVAANVVKLAGNLLLVSAVEAMAEAVTLAEKNGVDRKTFIEVIGQTIFGCPIYQNYGKMIAEEAYEPAGFKLELGFKDVRLAMQAAQGSRTPIAFGSLLQQRLLSAMAKGRGHMDLSALGLSVSEDAGLK
jgi:3-hydroxyisobutyrate dehydrogenase-like beta-hydroxyacid dehydrogenase